MLVPLTGGSQYCIYFIYDSSRITWLYFFRKKFEVFGKFQEFKSHVEDQTGKNTKVLRTDNEGDFCGKMFEQLCRQHNRD